MHMSVQLKKMEGKLRTVDLIIEVHDARVPISGRNPQFYNKLYGVRPHILVLNKRDLIDLKKYKRPIEEYYAEQGVQTIIWTDCKRRLSKTLHELRTKMVEMLNETQRYNREVKTEYQIMVVGIPNVGKSSLINSLRSTNLGMKHNAVVEGARPGVTVRVQNRVRILDKPSVYILDTPGVLCPSHRNVDEAMKLALCDLILESQTSPHHVADYLLYWLNKREDFSYLNLLGIDGEPTDDLNRLLLRICAAHDLRVKRLVGSEYAERWDMERAANMLVTLFRKNKLSDCCLDHDLLNRGY
ncbi:unnamed protein product [Auanema sp. JU1783]|nr:unnamed protein product [Auanema sp. JU1783]